MVIKKFRNILLSTALAGTLTACGGGGGGGGAVNTVTNFVDNTVSQLAGSESIVNSYSSTLSTFNSLLSGGDLSMLSAITSPDTKTRQSASNILTTISSAETLWSQTTALIDAQSTDRKLAIYNSNSYKDAYAAYLYLTETVKPIVQKVSAGTGISTDEFNRVADSNIVTTIIADKRSTTVTEYVSIKLSELSTPEPTPTPEPEPEVTVTGTITLDPTVTSTAVDGDPYTVTTYVDGEDTTTTTTGEAVTTTTTTNNVVDTENSDGTTTRRTYTITTTTTVTPTTTTVTATRTYTDVVKKDVTTTTTTTPNIRTTYSNGTSVDSTGTPVVTTAIATLIVSTTTRSETVTKSTSTENTTVTTNDNPGVLVSTETISNAYTDRDPNLGTKTPGYSSVKSTYETNEYLDRDADGNLQGWIDGGKKQVKASDAYSRGWTGKGVKIAVADTGYDTDHSEFTGQVFATQDYTGTGINDVHGHGTHVLGSIVAKKDGTGTHGVAFDATAAVIKIGNSSYVNISDAARGFSWAADQGAVVGNLSANSNYDSLFRSNLTALSDGTYKSTDSRYDYSTGQFYNLQTPTDWKAATDKGLVIVNSAGNQGVAVSANPGYFATAVDGNGDLVLGGKMLIVGAIDQNGNMASWSNKAGHICQSINVADNTCNDTYKVSNFYILAPGWTYSTKNDGTYGTMAGTSMAAPYVTGGVALISQMWPYMKGENLVKLLTTTACKSACVTDYNVNIHGSGLMDLEAATRPVGAVGIPTTGRTTSSVSTVSLSNSGGSGSSLSALSNIPQLSKVMIVDEFARDFYVNMTKGIIVKDTRKFSDVRAAQQGLPYLSFQQQYGAFEQGGQFAIGQDLTFGLYNTTDTKGDWTTNITKGWNLTENLKLKTTVGYMSEQKSWLGNTTDGALAVGKNNNTQFGQVGVEYKLGSNTFSFDVGQGRTQLNTVSNSMITNADNLQTQSMKIGWDKQIDDKSKWGVTYSIPNRIKSGSVNLNVPYATTLDGEVIYDNVRADLSAKTPEKDIGIYYSSQPESELEWKTSFSIEYRQNVAGVAGDNKFVPAMQVSKKFYGACMSFFGMKNERPGCQKIRAEEKLSKLMKQKGKEKEIADLKLKLEDINQQIAVIHGTSDRDVAQTQTDRKAALGWNR
jgi:subtilisin family serine protease